MSGRKLAQSVRVERDGDTARLFIDDVEFPYLLAMDPIEIGPLHPDEPPTVRFTLLAARLDVTNADHWEESNDAREDDPRN